MPAIDRLFEPRADASRHAWSALVTVAALAAMTSWRPPAASPEPPVEALAMQLLSEPPPVNAPPQTEAPKEIRPPSPPMETPPVARAPVAPPPPAERPAERQPERPAEPPRAAVPERSVAPTPEPAAAPAVQPERVVDKAVDKAIDKAIDKSDPGPDRRSERPAERAAAKAERSPERSSERPAERPADRPAEKLAERAPERPSPPPERNASRGGTEDSFVGRIHAALEANKRYPTGREASQQRPTGIVKVWFVLSRSGALIDCGVAEPSPSILLDKAALSTVRRASFPAMPEDAWPGQEQHRFSAQLEFMPPG